MEPTVSSILPLADAPTALFLGAGFSKWAADLPVARELFDLNIDCWGPRDETKLGVLRALKRTWDQSHPGCGAEEFVAYGLLQPRKQREALLWYLGRRVSEPFMRYSLLLRRERRYTLMIDDKAKLRVPGVVTARRFLEYFTNAPLSGILTTNYDLLIEYALGTRVFNYGRIGKHLLGSGPYPLSQWKYPVLLRGRVPLAKLHGSISWDEYGCYADGRRAITGRALIVAPTPEKRPPPELAETWALAERVLLQAEHLLVFGFAFNPYDEAVLNLLASSQANIRSVLLVDIAPQIDRAKEVWPAATVASCPPPPEGLEVVRAWRDGEDGGRTAASERTARGTDP
jgi:hypothetical protein